MRIDRRRNLPRFSHTLFILSYRFRSKPCCCVFFYGLLSRHAGSILFSKNLFIDWNLCQPDKNRSDWRCILYDRMVTPYGKRPFLKERFATLVGL